MEQSLRFQEARHRVFDLFDFLQLGIAPLFCIRESGLSRVLLALEARGRLCLGVSTLSGGLTQGAEGVAHLLDQGPFRHVSPPTSIEGMGLENSSRFVQLLPELLR